MVSVRYYEPGEAVSTSAIYSEVDRYGKATGRNVTCVKREVFPPTQAPGRFYVIKTITNPK